MQGEGENTEPIRSTRRKDNSIVPYPDFESLSRNGDLEKYVDRIMTENFYFPYEDLPGELTAGGIETYANWLQDLTAQDPQQRERAAYVHVKRNPYAFLYTPNPYIGEAEESSIDFSFSPNFDSMVRVHSHQNSTSFSLQDQKNMYSHWSNDKEIKHPVDIVAAKSHNYLLVQTADSEFPDFDEFSKEMDSKKNVFQEGFNNYIESLTSIYREQGMDDESIGLMITCILFIEEQNFGANYITYSLTIGAVHAFAEKYKFGFYVSNRDGQYHRVSNQDLKELGERHAAIMPQARKLYLLNGGKEPKQTPEELPDISI